MQHNKLRLINLYIQLKVAKAKERVFKETGEVPHSLKEHIKVLKKEITERKNACQ